MNHTAPHDLLDRHFHVLGYIDILETMKLDDISYPEILTGGKPYNRAGPTTQAKIACILEAFGEKELARKLFERFHRANWAIAALDEYQTTVARISGARKETTMIDGKPAVINVMMDGTNFFQSHEWEKHRMSEEYAAVWGEYDTADKECRELYPVLIKFIEALKETVPAWALALYQGTSWDAKPTPLGKRA